MTDLEWLDATAVEFPLTTQITQKFGHGPDPIKAKAVALAGNWLLVEQSDGPVQIIPADNVARVYLAEGSPRPERA